MPASEYPGLGLPLRYYDRRGERYPIGAHYNFAAFCSDIISVREVAMMYVMDRLTDKADWHKKVFDDAIVSKWRKEAFEIPDEYFWAEATGAKGRQTADGQVRNIITRYIGGKIKGEKRLENIMSQEAFDYCIEELRNKARYYEVSGLVPTLNASASVVKSDTLVSAELHTSLREAFQRLMTDQASSPDWHPKSGDMVQDLVHPSMYPLVYGRSGVFRDEVVGVGGAIEKYAGKGEVIEKEEPPEHYGLSVGASSVPHSYWSNTYQWLPANVAFQDDGSVKFTSYINNLHPTKYPEIYRTVERLIETVLPAWDQCLDMPIPSPRFTSPVPSPRFDRPKNPDDYNKDNWDPSDQEVLANAEVNWEDLGEIPPDPEQEDVTERKWEALRKPVQPQPHAFKEVDYTPLNRIAEKFRKMGLQVIVKMASIELTPEKPEFPAGGWHVEGQINERICATALYYLDSENVTASNLSFRLQTSWVLDEEGYKVSQDGYRWMELVYGANFGGGPCLQNYGNVETPQGRLLAFSNVFHHRVSSFRLADPTKPGHRRFIALWLVDPHVRIISTANVAPQQLDWWMDSVTGGCSSSAEAKEAALSKLPAELVNLLAEKGAASAAAAERKKKGEGEGLDHPNPDVRLPPELMDMVRSHLDADGGGIGSLMSEAEAKEHRLKLMEARSAFHMDADEEWHQQSYSFCEH